MGDFRSEPKLIDIELPPEDVTPEAIEKFAALERRANLPFVIAGGVLIVVGLAFVVAGINGAIKVNFNIHGFSGGLENASPGIVCVLLGSVLLYVGRNRVKVRVAAKTEPEP